MTVTQVADYYEVGIEAIKSMIYDYHDKFLKYGMKILNNEKLREFKMQHVSINKFIPTLTIIPCKAILYIGILLNDSPVANKIREEIVKSNDIELLKLLKDNNPNIHRKQLKLKEILENTYNGICNFNDQVHCGNYIIDYVINGNIAIECDEFGHRDRNKKYEIERQKYIEHCGYKVLRYNPDDESANIFSLLNKINILLKISP